MPNDIVLVRVLNLILVVGLFFMSSMLVIVAYVNWFVKRPALAADNQTVGLSQVRHKSLKTIEKT